MINVLMRMAQQIRRSYWWLVRPVTYGVRGIVLNVDGAVLLVKHRYQPGWYLPGGKMRKVENVTDTLKREVLEEVGLPIVVERTLGTYLSEQEYKRDTIHVLVAQSLGPLGRKFNLEVEEAIFFPLDNLPAETSPATRRRLAEYRDGTTPSPRW